MEMEITFPGGAQVDASFDGFRVETDQPRQDGGRGSAPTPFAMFLSSIGTCAGIYVLGFLRQRGLPTRDVRLMQRAHFDPATGMIGEIDLQIQVPEGFPARYLPALERAAALCAVKKHLEIPPRFNISTTIGESMPA
jgi:putative redox protein